MKKIYQSTILLFISCIIVLTASAQNIEWEKKIGGNPEWASTPGIDQGKSIVSLSDGTSVVLINSSSSEGEFPTNSGKRDAWLFKLNASGGVVWKQRYGGAGDDIGNHVIATSDGGFIISGQSTSYPGPDINAWIIKTDANGNSIWNKSFGGWQIDVANSICQTSDGYVFTGYTKSNDGNLSGIKTTINDDDLWFVKLDLSGNIVWNKIFGGFWIDQGNSIIPVTDGTGFAIAGFTQSNDRDVAGLLKGWRSGLVIKVDNAGTLVWKKTFGGNNDSRAFGIINIPGGGFAFAGATESSIGDITNPKGGYDYWLVKLDAAGTLTFSKNYGGIHTDFAYGLAATSDGGHVLIGRSDSPSGGINDLSIGAHAFDSWVIKVDASGNKVWDKNYRVNDDWAQDNGASVAINSVGEVLITGAIVQGVPHYDWGGTKDENAFVIKYSASGTPLWTSNFGVQRKFSGFDKGIALKQAPDGSYYFLAATESNDGDMGGLGAKAARDILIQKWDVNRNLVWQKIIGGLKSDDPKDMKVTPDGGVIIAATSYSTDGDLIGTLGNTIHGDLWLIKVSSSGTIEWKKNYGGHGDDYAHSIELAPGGGYVVATHSWSWVSGDITAAPGESNAWVIKVDAAGNKVWEKTFGGTGQEEANKIIATSDGGYAISGWTRSTTGDFLVNRGGFDAFVVKFDANGVKQWSRTYGGSSEDYGDAIAQAADGNLYLSGRSNSTNGEIAPLATGLTYEWNAFVMKLSITDGSITWSKSIGGAYYDELRDLIMSSSGDPLLVLFSDGGPGDFTENKGFHDTWIVKINAADGAIKWKKNYGGSLNDDPVSISRAHNGGYLVAGVGNFDNLWDQLDFTNNGEAYAIKISDNEVQYVTITTSGPAAFCEGNSVTLTAVSAGAVSFQWYKNGTILSGATNATYVANATGTYSVNATNSSGGIATASIDVVVNPAPSFAGAFNAGDIKQSISFGGYGNDNLTTFRQGLIATTDGGYIFTGQTNTSNNGDLAGLPYYGGIDVVVVKMDCGFNVQWKKTFGGSGNDQGYAVIQTADGGYMVTAITSSSISGNITDIKGGQDAWLIKLDANGNLQWQKNYGGTGTDVVNSIVQTSEGDYIFVGNTLSIDGDLTGLSSKGLQDIWVVKINSAGSIITQKRTGGTNFEDAYYINRTNDGNFILTGISASNDGNMVNAKGGQDGYVEKFSSNLSKIWSRNYGGYNTDHLTMFKPDNDGNYILSGLSVTGESNIVTNGGLDFWIMKLGNNGDLLWERLYGGPSTDQGQSIEFTNDGGYILTGVTVGNGGNVTGFKGFQDTWVIRLDANGNLIWQKTYGGTNAENGASIVKNNSGDFVLLSRAASTDGDLSGLNKGGADLWLTRIADCSSFVTASITPASNASVIYANSFTLSANTGSGYSYQWFRNNTTITGATELTYNAVQTGIYKVKISINGSCPGYSNEVSLVFNNKYYVNDNSSAGDLFTSAIGSNTYIGSAAAPFATLSFAVSQVKAGDTIYVDAGTYIEQVTIDKGLTIIGAGNLLTSFQKPATGIVSPPGDFTETALIQTLQGIGDVHISDMNITGDASAGLQCVIIQTGGSVKNCKLLDGNQGIFFRVASATKTAIIENNEINVPFIGVNVQGSGLSVHLRNNSITANNPGFSAGVFAGLDFGPLLQFSATGNLIMNYKNHGFLSNSFNSSITQNSFTGLNGSIAIQQQSGNTLNAGCNWYGTNDAESIKAGISGLVNYAPWLTSGVDTSTAIGFQPQLNVCNGRQNKFYVNDNNLTGDVFTTAIGNNANNGFSTAPFATMNYAISIAQAGDTIIVDAGTYIENVIVNKSLILRGVKHGSNPGTSLDRGNESLIMPATASSGLNGAIIQPAADNITIDGFLLDGDNPNITGGANVNGADANAGCGVYNINAIANYLMVKNCIVRNTNLYGIGLFKTYGNTTGPAVTGALFTTNHIYNVASRALVLAYDAYGAIKDNYVTRTPNGVWIGNQRVANLNDAPVVISGNYIEAYTLGIQPNGLQAPVPAIHILNNEVVQADLSLWSTPGVNTTQNTYGIFLANSTSTAGMKVNNNKVDGFKTALASNSTAGTITVNNNALTNYALKSMDFGGLLVDATCNWFGSAAAQDVEGKISGNVNYTPWLTSGTDNNVATGFQPVDGSCLGAGIDVDVVEVINVTCHGVADGSIDVMVEEGIAPFTFAWSKDDVGYATTEDLMDLGPGTYKLKVTDANGSVDETTTVTITQPAVLGVSSSPTNVTCTGNSDGTAGITVTGGTLPYSYLWSTGATTASISNLAAGDYSVTVTDANGCTANAEMTITEPESLFVSNDGQDISCNGENDGSISLSVSGGTGEYSFLWNNEATGSSMYDLSAGTYSVTVTDANGCTANTDITITEPEKLLVTGDGLDVSCYGANDGFISLSVSGGTGEYTFLWSNGATESSIYNLSAGTYSVLVTDANLCSAEGIYTILEPVVLAASATGTHVTSPGGSDGTISLSISGGTELYKVVWDHDATGTELTGQSAGIYSATITDFNDCTTTASFEVLESLALLINVTGTNVNCYNGNDGTASAEVTSGGTAPFSYEWNNGASTAAISNLSPGIYSVTVTDADNTTATGSFTVSAPAEPLTITNVSATPVSCFNGSNGTATVTATGGTGAYTYLWSNSGTTNVIENLTAGIYTVTVTDANGCTAESNTEVSQPTQLVAAVTATNVSCNGGSDGSAFAAATGGVSPYSYLWSNNVTTAANINLSIGTYTVTITDANGCTHTASYTVTQPPPVTGTVTKKDITCFGESNGSISVTGKGGTAPYQYSFNNGTYTNTNSWLDLAAGSYLISVKDANDCIYTTTLDITQPQPLVMNVDNVINTCQGTANGAISISVSGGTTRYSFSWTGPSGFTSVREDISSLKAGVYTITITDANGCIKTGTATVLELLAPSVTETVMHVSCFGTSTGSINIDVSPAGTYTYNWSGASGYRATTQNITNLKAGTYTVAVTPTSGCALTASYVVTQPASAVTFTTSKTDISVCGGTGAIIVTATGGTPPYQYSKGGNIYQQENSFTGLSVASYPITVKDNNGCITAVTNVSIVDNGSDMYEANERQTNAKEIYVNTPVNNARIAPTSTDKDWYKFTTTLAGTYSLLVTHPTVLYSYDVYDSRGRVITPVVTSATKNYTLLANTVYWVQVRGSVSFVCYHMQVTTTPVVINSTARMGSAGESVVYNPKPVNKEVLTVKRLDATAYPNPHNGKFNLLIKSPEDGVANIELFNVTGQKVIVKNVAVKAGDNIVTFNNIRQSLLLYKISVGKNYISGKIIGAN